MGAEFLIYARDFGDASSSGEKCGLDYSVQDAYLW
jgi:hypothetical protein